MDDKYSTEKLIAAGVDEEWIVLHRWIRTFRVKKSVSVTSFLYLCELDPSSRYYKKLCSLEMGIVYRPSLRNGSFGKIFRDAATKLMFDTVCHPLREVSFLQSIENAVADWKIDNFNVLVDRGVHDVFVTGTSHVKYYVVEGANFTRDEFIEMLSSDTYLQGQLTESALTIQEVRCQLLLDHSCVGINDGVSSGTATYVSVNGTPPILMTAAHVSRNSFVVRINDFDSVVTDKWVPNHDGSIIAKVPACLKDIENDVAFGILKSRADGPVLNLDAWWKDQSGVASAAYVIARQLLGQVVIKDGASTGITTGTVIDVTAGVVLVTGNEQTPFSAPGDSGAVVRMKESDDAIGIVS